MRRVKLRNEFLKNPTKADRFSYSKQRNWCLSPLRKEKRIFSNLYEKNITDNKNFWKTFEPFLSEKTKSRETITYIENAKMVLDDAEVANCIFNVFLKQLKILKYKK